MWKELLAATALSTALAMTPALAQQTGQGQMQGETQQRAGQEGAQYKGWPVFSSDGEKVGEVTEVMPSATGQGQKLRVQSDGFFGIGAKTVEINPDQYEAGQNRIELTMSADEAKGLPES